MDELELLRREIQELSERKSMRRYPQKLREHIAAWARVQLARGVSPWQASRRLDLGQGTLQRILDEVDDEGEVTKTSLVPVRVVEDSAPARTRVVVRGPCGIVVEGLGIAEVASLLRALS